MLEVVVFEASADELEHQRFYQREKQTYLYRLVAVLCSRSPILERSLFPVDDWSPFLCFLVEVRMKHVLEKSYHEISKQVRFTLDQFQQYVKQFSFKTVKY